MKYKPCNGDLANRFEDIIGVTLYEDKDIEHILFWVSNQSKDYMETKPIHGSQCRYKGKKMKNFVVDIHLFMRVHFFNRLHT